MIFALFADKNAGPYMFTNITTGEYEASPNIHDIAMTLFGSPTTGKLYLYDAREGPFGSTTGLASIPDDFGSELADHTYKYSILATKASKP